MKLKWGNYVFPENSMAVGVNQTAVLNSFQVPWAYDVVVNASGRFTVTSQADAVRKERDLYTALQVPYQRLVFLTDDGKPTSIDYSNSNTLGGVVITGGPGLPNNANGQYATVRDFEFTATFRIPILNADTAVLRYHDSMRYTGGGPVYRYKPAIDAAAQKQQVWKFLPYHIDHAGEAVGFRAYPLFTPALPACLMQTPDVSKESPSRYRNAFVEFPIRWSAIYESNSPMNILPNVWNPK